MWNEKKSLVYLDAGIVNTVGHNLETVRHLARECPKEFDFEVWAGANFKSHLEGLKIEACLPYGSPHWPKKSRKFQLFEKFENFSNSTFLSRTLREIRRQETLSAIRSKRVRPSSVYIINSVEIDDAIFQAAAIFKCDTKSLVSVLLHYSPFCHDSTTLRPHVRLGIEQYKSLMSSSRTKNVNLNFFADTWTLCDVYSALLGCEVRRAPIPHLNKPINCSADVKATGRQSHKITAGFFGVYTETKSPHLLVEAIPRVSERQDINWLVAITFLARNKTIDSFTRQMQSMGHAVDYKEGPFDSTYVDEIFKSVDIFIATYHAHDYEIQSSGIVMEAIASGAIPIVSKSMVDAPELHKIDRHLTIRPNNAQDLVDSLVYISANLDKFKRKLAPLKDSITKFHNPENFFRILSMSKS